MSWESDIWANQALYRWETVPMYKDAVWVKTGG